jgi:hypothetical protein
MKTVSRIVLAGCFLATLAATIAKPAAAQPPAPATPMPSLDALLKGTGFDFTPRENVFRVVVEADSETTMVIARLAGTPEKPHMQTVEVFTQILEVPQGFKHPAGMLKKIAEINDRLRWGRVSVDPERGNVYYSSSFWLRTADAQTLEGELYIAHFTRLDLRKELMPFVKE